MASSSDTSSDVFSPFLYWGEYRGEVLAEFIHNLGISMVMAVWFSAWVDPSCETHRVCGGSQTPKVATIIAAVTTYIWPLVHVAAGVSEATRYSSLSPHAQGTHPKASNVLLSFDRLRCHNTWKIVVSALKENKDVQKIWRKIKIIKIWIFPKFPIPI